MADGARQEEIAGNPRPRVSLRPATLADDSRLMRWRNDRITVKNSLSGKPVELSAHLDWFLSALKDPTIEIYIAEDGNGLPVGMIRLNAGSDHIAMVSITIDPKCRGVGFGRAVLEAGCLLKSDWTLTALIRNTNKASISIFEGCGFCLVSEGEDGFRAYTRGRLLL